MYPPFITMERILTPIFSYILASQYNLGHCNSSIILRLDLPVILSDEVIRFLFPIMTPSSDLRIVSWVINTPMITYLTALWHASIVPSHPFCNHLQLEILLYKIISFVKFLRHSSRRRNHFTQQFIYIIPILRQQ